MQRRAGTDIFDIRARQDGDHVAMLDTEIVADDSIDASAAIVKLLVGENNENGILSLFASDEDCVASE